MAYYYRGMLYLQNGDIENARACFRGGILQDAFAEEEQHRCDFALMLYLEMWASLQLGDFDAAEDTWKELYRLRPDCPKPTREHNVLIVGETGTSPRKLADGVGHAELVYRRGKAFSDTQVQAVIDQNSSLKLYPIEDIYMQACTRGGRMVDRILEGKVLFRQQRTDEHSVLSTVGEASMLASSFVHHSKDVGNLQAIGGGFAVAGAFCGLMAMNAKPHADTRYWQGLPDAVHVVSLNCTPGTHRVTFQYLSSAGASLPSLAKSTTVQVGNPRPAIVWMRSPD
ncbi:MAG: hypothetical protein JXQ75_23475 [Phycisphaerae bacterium]|nr:hypothetical protein [Phycisphaerae bacterium]